MTDYNGLHLELQLRTRIQHSWATAVETMGTFLGETLKSGQGEKNWRYFFEVASSGFAHLEKSQLVPDYETLKPLETFQMILEAEEGLGVLEKLRSFSIAAEMILQEKGQGIYNLIVLDSNAKSVSIRPYPLHRLQQANEDYALIEKRSQNGERIEAVLVSVGSIEDLKRAYPNYFLDTHEFIRNIERIKRRAVGRR